jgi:hypothetical protein
MFEVSPVGSRSVRNSTKLTFQSSLIYLYWLDQTWRLHPEEELPLRKTT